MWGVKYAICQSVSYTGVLCQNGLTYWKKTAVTIQWTHSPLF